MEKSRRSDRYKEQSFDKASLREAPSGIGQGLRFKRINPSSTRLCQRRESPIRSNASPTRFPNAMYSGRQISRTERVALPRKKRQNRLRRRAAPSDLLPPLDLLIQRSFFSVGPMSFMRAMLRRTFAVEARSIIGTRRQAVPHVVIPSGSFRGAVASFVVSPTSPMRRLASVSSVAHLQG